MKQIICIAIFLINTSIIYSQIGKDPISINIEIVQKGNFKPYGVKCNDCYVARLEIVNNQDTALPVTFWTCFWATNWESNNDSIRMLLPPMCTANFPDETDIPSKQSLIFYSTIYINPKAKNKLVKLGFTNMNGEFKRKNHDPSVFLNTEDLISSGKAKGKTYWSKELDLEDILSESYFVK